MLIEGRFPEWHCGELCGSSPWWIITRENYLKKEQPFKVSGPFFSCSLPLCVLTTFFSVKIGFFLFFISYKFLIFSCHGVYIWCLIQITVCVKLIVAKVWMHSNNITFLTPPLPHLCIWSLFYTFLFSGSFI